MNIFSILIEYDWGIMVFSLSIKFVKFMTIGKNNNFSEHRTSAFRIEVWTRVIDKYASSSF